MNAVNYISTAEFQSFNPDLDFSQLSDPTISGMIQRASAVADSYIEYSMGIEDIVAEDNEAVVNSRGNMVIFTRKVPIVSVSSIQLRLGTVSMDLSLTDGAGNNRWSMPSRASYIVYPFQEISLTGTLSVRNFYDLRQNDFFVRISYRAGYETIPADFKDAVNLIAREIMQRQSNPAGASSITQGAISLSFDRDSDKIPATLRQARDLLDHYRKVTA